MELRGYQEKTVELVRDELRKGNKRVLVCLPTGAGKSHTMGYIASKTVENGHKVLALMHRRQLVDQLCERFEDCGLEAGKIMSGVESALDKKAQIGTCQTYRRRTKSDFLARDDFFVDASVVMIDEAHHTLSSTYQKILKQYDGKIIIGVTATPVLASGVGMGEFFDSLVCPVTVQELVDDGYLVPGVYYGPSTPDLSKIKTVAGDFEKKSLNKVMNQPKLIGEVVENWLRLAGGMKTMVFAVKVNHSKALRDEFLKYGVSAEHLDAFCDDEKREETLNRFRSGETQVLCNVGLYTEGTDIPEIECIVLARPTKSLGLHLQMVGRGARPFPGKDSFTVIDHGGNIERLGFYEDEIRWSLSGKEVGYKVVKPRVRERKIMTCEMCWTQFTGCVCPRCSHPVPDFGKKISEISADLVELKRGKEKKFTMEDKRDWYSMFKHEQERMGKSESWLLAQYKSKFGVWPRNMHFIEPMPPSDECRNWLVSQRIRYAKRMQKREASVERADDRQMAVNLG